MKEAKRAHIWSRDEFDFYIEPRWCSQRLFRYEEFRGIIYVPAAGTGRVVDAAIENGLQAFGSDIVIRDARFTARDFLRHEYPVSWRGVNIVTNPPFQVADEFARKVALLLPATWHCGAERSLWLQRSPLRRVRFLTPRPSMPPGAVVMSGEEPGGGTKDFAWYIWERGYAGRPELGWLRRDN
jgi:hypothetical protein